MSVKAILDQKGRDVVTVPADMTLAHAIALLGEKNIGAVVVVDDGGAIVGILSERDVVRRLGKEGAAVLDARISKVMTAHVETCLESHMANDVMEIMTRLRIRHLPVAGADGKLAGIVSIGDLVKQRIEDVEREAEEIRSYIATA